MTHFSVEVLASCVGDRLHGGYKVTQNEAIRSSFPSFTSIIRQVAMNFEKETKTLPESSFFCCARESSSSFNKKEAQRMAFLP